MALFKYKAIAYDGGKMEGEIRAANQTEATIELKKSCSTILEIRETAEQKDLLAGLKRGKIKEKQLSLICKQFSIILSAGIPLVRTVKLVADQTEDMSIRTMLDDVADGVSTGHSLAGSFEQFKNRLPVTFIETVRAGEQSGSLDKTFGRLADYFEKRAEIKAKVKKALTYPAFVIVVAIIVVCVIMVVAVPMFTNTFQQMHIELPFITVALIAVSDFFRSWLWLIIVIVIAAILAVKFYARTESGKAKIGAIKLKLPVIGKIQHLSCSSDFASTFSTLLAAGLPVTKAMNVAAMTLSNFAVGESVKKAARQVEQGTRIAESLRRTDMFPNLLVEMVGVGEESGSLEETLDVVGEYYDNEVETATTQAVSILEPAIIVVLALIVVVVLLAVYMPMFSMYGSI